MDMLEIKENPIILRKRIKIYVDFSIKDDNVYTMGQRLISFFGQASIFENTEMITEDIEDFFEELTLNFLTFGEDKQYEDDILNKKKIEDLKFIDESFEDYIQNNFNTTIFFLPIVIFFYNTEKRTDFFISATFKKRYQINVHKLSLIINYLKFKEKKFSFFNLVNYFYSIKKYFSIINLIKNFNNLNFVNVLNLAGVTYLNPEKYFYETWNQYIFYITKENNKSLFFKSYIYKLKKNSIYLLKKITSLPLQYILSIVSLKVFFLDEDFEYSTLIENFIHYISQMYISKRTLFRRLRRRKRFKRKIGRNYIGNKISYYKIYAPRISKKKKKREWKN